ncbi:MAG: hypothetical protein H0T15_05160 [Thermoleophilaceae bacterium]|nr:hypothetical protein [Thermoleophilaceae bacterium]
MTGRTAALLAALALICLLAYLTVRVFVESGFDLLVGVALLVLALFGFGVLGALTEPRE